MLAPGGAYPLILKTDLPAILATFDGETIAVDEFEPIVEMGQ